jgi:hypothetical protein
MTYRGRIKDGSIVLDEPLALPDGTEVEIAPVVAESAAASAGPTWAEVLKDVIGKAEGLPPDLAENHDHYIHGVPKR